MLMFDRLLNAHFFDPTGGGQPNDIGTLGEARVVDCIDMEDAGVLHVIQGPTPDVGEVTGGPRRVSIPPRPTPCSG